ncbi:MAG: DUF5615 family PIN-like protein [Planctomycetota bacterium]|nr:DUF5615 family PIN-like protein [Planctomycetota bacterium]
MRPHEIRLLTNEHISPIVVEHLRRKGVDAVTVTDLGLRGRSDSDVLAAAHRQSRAVLTMDADFGGLAIQRGEPCFGIVFVRPGNLIPGEVCALLDGFISADMQISPPFVVVLEPGRIRLRSVADNG